MIPFPGSIKDHNMRYLGLRFYEEEMHREIMETPIAYWPESLVELFREYQDRYGFCGEVLSTAVADWIKGKRASQPEPQEQRTLVSSHRAVQLATDELASLTSRIRELAVSIAPEYPDIATVPATEALYAIESSHKGTLAALDDWQRFANHLAAKLGMDGDAKLAAWRSLGLFPSV